MSRVRLWLRVLVVSALSGCGPVASGTGAASAPPVATPPTPDSDTATAIHTAWDYADAKASERRFRSLVDQARQRHDEPAALEFETQVARAQGLDQRLGEARATLAAVAAELSGATRRPWP